MLGSQRGMWAANARWRGAYFGGQGFATLAWWLLVFMVPAVRRWFAFGDDGRSLLSFLPGDVIFWVLGSWGAAWGELVRAPWRAGLQRFVAGAVACSLVHAGALAVLAGTGFAGVGLMVPAVAVTWWLAWSTED